MATDIATLAVKVESSGVEQLNAKLEQLISTGTNAEKSLSQITTATSASASATANLAAGIAKLVAAAASVVTVTAAFKAGINAIDEFKVKTVGIAAGLTNIAQAGQGSFGQMFSQNLTFARQMYEEMRKEDAKRFASLDDMMVGYNALVQKGYAVRLDEVSALGAVVDRIKLATSGQNTEMQINQEIRALMDGQARAGSLLATELKDRLGPSWEGILKQQRDSGNLLEFLAGLYPGISSASQEIENTLEAQKTTLEGHLKYVGREGLAGAYDDIVGIMQTINEYLAEHGSQVSANIARAWEAVRDIITAIKGFIVDIYAICSRAITIAVQFSTSVIGPAASWLTGVGKGGAGDVMMAMGGTTFDEVNRQKQIQNQIEAQKPQYIGLGDPVNKGQTVARKIGGGGSGGGGGGGKGGGSTDALENKLASMVDTFNKEIARLVDGSRAAIDAWYNEQVRKIEQIGAKGVETQQVIALAGKAKNAKLAKLEEDFSKWYAQNSDDRLRQLDIEKNETLRKFRGSKEDELLIARVYDTKIADEKLNRQNELLSKQASLISGVAGLNSTPFQKQIEYQSKVLDLEQQVADANLITWSRKNGISDATRDELRAMQALVTQQKKFDVELQSQGFKGGLGAWAQKRSKEAEQSQYNAGYEIMNTLEQGTKQIGADIVKSMFEGGQVDIARIGSQMAERFVTGLVENGIKSLFNSLSQILMENLAGGIGGAIGGGGGGGILGTIMDIGSTIAGIFFHSGGVIPTYAHSGLRLQRDEIPIIAQSGEGILPRSTMAMLGDTGFEALRRGQTDFLRPQGGNVHLAVNISATDAKSVQRLFAQNGSAITKALANQARNFAKVKGLG
jgi:hypothetical protein